MSKPKSGGLLQITSSSKLDETMHMQDVTQCDSGFLRYCLHNVLQMYMVYENFFHNSILDRWLVKNLFHIYIFEPVNGINSICWFYTVFSVILLEQAVINSSTLLQWTDMVEVYFTSHWLLSELVPVWESVFFFSRISAGKQPTSCCFPPRTRKRKCSTKVSSGIRTCHSAVSLFA